MKKILLLIALGISISIPLQNFACTVIFAGKDATVDGSVIVSHSDDALEDNRLLYIEGKTYKQGEKGSYLLSKAGQRFHS